MIRLFVFGLGFTGQAVAQRLMARGVDVAGTCRNPEKADRLRALGIEALLFDGETQPVGIPDALAGTTHLLISIAPGGEGDPVLRHCRDRVAGLTGSLRRIVYLSTTAVYGDQDGEWIDEMTPVNPRSERARRRVAAEEGWRDLSTELDLPLDILRLSGIYGPGRSPLDSVRSGRARRIVKPGQVFNRIHVDDIAAAVDRLVVADLPGAVYNLADDEPAPPQDVVAHAAGLLGVAPPPEVAFEDADMTPMARSFYSESKRISNVRLKQALGLTLAYPTYREGLAAIASGR